jgi:hypothetical protein
MNAVKKICQWIARHARLVLELALAAVGIYLFRRHPAVLSDTGSYRERMDDLRNQVAENEAAMKKVQTPPVAFDVKEPIEDVIERGRKEGLFK